MSTFDFLGLSTSDASPANTADRKTAHAPKAEQMIENDDNDDSAGPALASSHHPAPTKKANMMESKARRPVTGVDNADSSDVVANSKQTADLPAKFDREQFVEKQLQLRSDEFSEMRNVRIITATWNVNGKRDKSGDEDLSTWLLPPESRELLACSQSKGGSKGQKGRSLIAVDVYVVGFQEIVDLNAGSIVSCFSHLVV